MFDDHDNDYYNKIQFKVKNAKKILHNAYCTTPRH